MCSRQNVVRSGTFDSVFSSLVLFIQQDADCQSMFLSVLLEAMMTRVSRGVRLVAGTMTVPGGLKDRLYGTIYGQCIGDAVGLLTEFMTGNKAAQIYPLPLEYYMKVHRPLQIYPLPLEYYMKVQDEHRDNWAVGDWTDDSDQMILIMQTLTSSGGKVDKSTTRDFAQRLQRWAAEGFPELGDKGGCGLGQTTQKVLKHSKFSQDPQHAAQQVWRDSGRAAAPRGALMRTSILGTLNYRDLPTVVSNTRAFCLTTHADPRCVESCVAVATSIALMLQGWRDVPGIVQESFQQAQAQLPAEKDAMNLQGKQLIAGRVPFREDKDVLEEI